MVPRGEILTFPDTLTTQGFYPYMVLFERSWCHTPHTIMYPHTHDHTLITGAEVHGTAQAQIRLAPHTCSQHAKHKRTLLLHNLNFSSVPQKCLSFNYEKESSRIPPRRLPP